MAGEITLNGSVQLKKGKINEPGITVKSLKVDQAGNGYQGNTLQLLVGIDTVVPVTLLTTPGIWQVRHTGTTGTLEVGPESGGVIVPLDKLNPARLVSEKLCPKPSFSKARGYANLVC